MSFLILCIVLLLIDVFYSYIKNIDENMGKKILRIVPLVIMLIIIYNVLILDMYTLVLVTILLYIWKLCKN
jgi:hypothetical protein